MIKMFRFVAIALGIALFSIDGNAQSASPVSFKVEAGWNMSKPTDTDKAKSGFNVGATAEYLLSRSWFLDAGIWLQSKPWEIDYASVVEEQKGASVKATPYYLNIPVHAGYRFTLTDKVAVTAALGPYIGVGLWGSGKERGSVDFKVDNVFDDWMKRFEIGADIRIGVEFMKHYLLSAGYSIQFNHFDGGELLANRNQVFSLSVGYKF